MIADAEGLDGLSMRRVATALGAAPMSLYRHVTDKDDLVLRMMDAALREARLPADPPPGWRPRLEVAARSLWAAFRRHPWLAPALSLTRPQAVAGGLAYTEWVLAALADAGLTTTVAFDVHLTLFTFVRGVAVNLESEAAEPPPAASPARSGWPRTSTGCARSRWAAASRTSSASSRRTTTWTWTGCSSAACATCSTAWPPTSCQANVDADVPSIDR